MGLFSKKENQPIEVSADMFQNPTHEYDSQFESEMKKAVKEWLNDPIAENRLEENPIWATHTKTSKLTFMDKYEIPMFEADTEAMISLYLMSKPPCEIGDEVIQEVNQLRMISRMNFRRSAGTENASKINERTIQATQIRQSMNVNNAPQKQGGLGRFFGLR